MKVLLIGGTGILSSDIMDLCVEKKYETYILNRGYSKKSLNKGAKLLIGDIRNKKQIMELMENKYFDIVVDFLTFNINQLKQNLDIFQGKCNQYIFISSATVYKPTKTGEKITEQTELKNNIWDYSINKIECEKYLKENYLRNKQKYTIVRPYITYSKKRIPFAIIPSKQWTLANRIFNNKPIILGGDGNQITTLTHTKDFAKGIVGLFNAEEAFQEDYHITTDYTLSWNEVAKIIGKNLNKNTIIAHLPINYLVKKLPEYAGTLLSDKGLKSREFNNNKIKSVVNNFEAKISFEDGIKSTFEYYNKNEHARNIDYMWDGKIDRIIKKYYNKKNISFDEKSLTMKAYKQKISKKDMIKYIIGKSEILYNLYFFVKRLKNYIMKKKVKVIQNDKNK